MESIWVNLKRLCFRLIFVFPYLFLSIMCERAKIEKIYFGYKYTLTDEVYRYIIIKKPREVENGDVGV